MNPTEIRRLVERYTSVWNTGELEKIDEICVANVSVFYPGRPEGIHGCDAVKKLIAAIRSVIPDLRLSIDEAIVEGEKVALRWTARGTQKGNWVKHVPATGKRVEWSGISIYRISDGRIAEERVEEDLLRLETQMGVVASVGPATS